jgi:hypothetical protein
VCREEVSYLKNSAIQVEGLQKDQPLPMSTKGSTSKEIHIPESDCTLRAHGGIPRESANLNGSQIVRDDIQL